MGDGLRICALAGGVGGAKLVNGLSRILPAEDLSVIVNTGDDFEYFGFTICPDIDTVIYNLAGINDPITGWGLANDTAHVIEGLTALGHSPWFRLGDRDIATHIERTRLLRAGETLSQVTLKLAHAYGIRIHIIPMADTPVPTQVITKDGQTLPFQEYFVKFQSKPEISRLISKNAETAALPKPARERLEACDLVIICPSNPYLSIDPILSIPGARQLLTNKTVVAVSPLIGGKTIKGPAAKIMVEFGIQPCAINIARHYAELISGFVLDNQDEQEQDAISRCGIIPLVTNILMPDLNSQRKLAQSVLDFGKKLLQVKQI